MIMNFGRSDDFFVELVHDETKRASTLAAWRSKRKNYFLHAMFYGAFGLACLFSSIVMLRLSIVCFTCFALFMSIHGYYDNKIKMILYIEEMQKQK